MRRTRRNIWRALRGLTVAFATAVVVTGPATAGPLTVMPEGYAPSLEAELALIDAGQSPVAGGVSRPDGYQPQLRGGDALVIRGAPDGYQPQTRATPVAAVSAGSDGIQVSDAALGFGFGLALATALGICLLMVRGRTGVAHS